MNNKVSILFGEDKAEIFLFYSRHNLKLPEEQEIRYDDIRIEQYNKHVNTLTSV